MESTFIIPGSTQSILVQLTDESFSGSKLFAQNLKHIRWGAGDNQPNLMRKLMIENNQLQAELDTLRDMIYGSGGRFYKKNPDGTAEPFYDEKLNDWAEETNLDLYEITAITQLVELGNIFTRFEWDLKSKKPFISVSDAFITRIGGLKKFVINPTFGKVEFSEKNSNEINGFDSEKLMVDIVQVLHSKKLTPGNPHYAFPSWWMAKEWIELANLIPVFHKNGIKNGYNIKYIIKMPADYFDAEGAGKSDAKEIVRKKWMEFEEKMRKMLSGEANVNKALLVKYLRGDAGAALDTIKIEPIDNKMSDDAYSKILEMSMQNIANAIGLVPTLAGVNPGKGNDSGSQIRVMADYQQHFRTTIPRTIVADAVNKSIRLMGYKNIYRWYDGIQITTLDTNSNGIQSATNFPVNQ